MANKKGATLKTRATPPKMANVGRTTVRVRGSDALTLKRQTVYITPEQDAALRAEALRQWTARGQLGRVDSSDVVRGILDAWIKTKK